MGLRDFLRRGAATAGPTLPRAASATWGYSLTDPALAEAIRGQDAITIAGEAVNGQTALTNSAIFRSVSLISNAIGMLPLHLIDEVTKQKATAHPLYALLHREPNAWQTAFEFRKLMQRRALVKGNAYARIVRSPRSGDPIALVPLDPDRTSPVQNTDWSVSYRYNPPSGGEVMLAPGDVLHLRGDSDDGIKGNSLVFQAREAIGLALGASRAAGRIFKQGSFIDGVLQTESKLSDPARKSLLGSWSNRHAGADNAGKTPLLEEGVKYVPTGTTARDAQMSETMARMVEEIARFFGVPRPLLMVDETSWGSGIDSLGQLFVQYGLNPWFSAWEQAIDRSLLSAADKDRYTAKFNAGALERGSMESQGAFFSAALGAGGHAPWMTPNEVRDLLDMPAHPDGDSLKNPLTAPRGQTGTTENA